MTTPNPTPQPTRASLYRTLLLGGVLPIIAFTVAEQFYGTVGGLIAGITFGVGEITYELIKYGKVQGITIAANLLVVGLGGLSLLEDDPTFFKLQPAIVVFAFAALLIGSSLIKKPFLAQIAKKQMPHAPEQLLKNLGAMNFRAGLCMIAIGILSVHAAYNWSTAAWATLKGIGTPVAFAIYMGAEILIFRLRIKISRDKARSSSPENPR